MDRSIKANMKKFVNEKIIKRKAMFMPIMAVGTFMLVGYAAVDKEKPVIHTQEINLEYGETIDHNVIDASDNRDDANELEISVDNKSFDNKQLGSYNVEVTAKDSFSNEVTKTVKVNVVDTTAPEFSVKGDNGYVVEVPINSSNDLSSYVKAYDAVDGDVTTFITSDKPLDTTKSGKQDITLTVSDTAGNVTTKPFTFVVSDLEAPTITLKQDANIVVDFKSTFDINNYVTVTDNVDTNVKLETKGQIDPSKEGDNAKIVVTATDGAGNSSKAELNATVKDITGPAITLSTNNISVDQGATVDLKSYLTSATDNTDGDMKDKVSIGTLDTSSTGTKTVSYSATDSKGNRSESVLTVNVQLAGQKIVDTGKTKLGCPYVWGATGPNTFDCSGFTQWVYRQNGISIPRTSGEQRASAKQVVSVSEAQVGDILWRNGHVGIYIGNGQYMHAPHTGDVVKISSLSSSSFTNALRFK